MLDKKLLEKRGIVGKYADLAIALEAAQREAIALYGSSEDGGTCNFDSPKLYLPRWNGEKIKAAAAAAGCGAWKFDGWGRPAWIVTPHGMGGQGNRRTRIAEHMQKRLSAAGFDAWMFYQMD